MAGAPDLALVALAQREKVPPVALATHLQMHPRMPRAAEAAAIRTDASGAVEGRSSAVRGCRVCAHPLRDELERALVPLDDARDLDARDRLLVAICRRYRVSSFALERHAASHAERADVGAFAVGVAAAPPVTPERGSRETRAALGRLAVVLSEAIRLVREALHAEANATSDEGLPP